MSRQFRAAVVGGGPAGLVAALALGKARIEVFLAAPPHRTHAHAPDNRTAALFAGSIELLKNVNAWEAIAPSSAPIRAIRIIDDTGALLRAPEVVFTAAEVGLDVFGWNVPNSALVAGLLDAASRSDSGVSLRATRGIAQVAIAEDSATLSTQEGDTLVASLVVGADGRNSICRSAAGIATTTWQYEQAAIATTFSHSRPHRSISTEFHRPSGPFTTVPLPGLASSLVWVERPDEAQRLAALDEASFRAALEERLQGLLGTIGDISPRAVFPLSGLTAAVYGQNRTALVGESGHVIPPIGAQGLNLGFRDAAALADCVATALGQQRDPGEASTLAAYNAHRRPDVTSRITTIDVLNRSLISDLVPVHLARGLGLVALKTFPPLRRFAIREGLQPSREVSSLLLPDGAHRLTQRREAAMTRHSAA
ncbi:UbiH/UbiF family hydroxylase [Hyphomicrobium sp.]|uniref:UbiH/UbiF family hydroxylase n=1 Tax=Hyphomicrobium sp. TaxID=82 RepID=UPI002E341B04|nr:UbiH/UbiF family hydroxylase [Hyphomicrobium sp.]HEX2839678.1 UbiH/UbiF family hydroxylase [Hyphomicrobium sp.]